MQILTVWLVRSVDEVGPKPRETFGCPRLTECDIEQRPRPDVVATRGTIPPRQPDEGSAPVRRLPDTPQGDPHNSRFNPDPRYRPAQGSFADSRYAGVGRRDPAFTPHRPNTSSATYGMAPPYAYPSTGATGDTSSYEMAYHQATPFPSMMTPPFSQYHDTGAVPGYMSMYPSLTSPPMLPLDFRAWSGRTDVAHSDDRQHEAGSAHRRRGRNV